MKIYVAGKTHDITKVRHVQELCRITGHHITHDWTKDVEREGGNSDEQGVPPDRQRRYAMLDMAGVYQCDWVIAVGHPQLCGTLIEVGMAIAWNREVWAFQWSNNARRSVFEHLANFKFFEDLGELQECLWARSERRLEREFAPDLWSGRGASMATGGPSLDSLGSVE